MFHAKALNIEPLVPSRWKDLVGLFGPRGACGGCWCMTPRLARSEYERCKGEGNKRALKRIVDSGTIGGVLAYTGIASVFQKAGFREVARRSETRPIMRRQI